MSRLFAGTAWDRPPRCDRCGALVEACQCPPPPREFADPTTQRARVLVERRKRGKMVTVVRGLSPEENDLRELLSSLKTQIGAGGTIQDDALEIQGDQLTRVRELLAAKGFRLQ